MAWIRATPLVAYFASPLGIYAHELYTDKLLREGADPKELSQRWWQQQTLGQLRYRKRALDEEAGAKRMEEFVKAKREEKIKADNAEFQAKVDELAEKERKNRKALRREQGLESYPITGPDDL